MELNAKFNGSSNYRKKKKDLKEMGNVLKGTWPVILCINKKQIKIIATFYIVKKENN